MLCVEDCPGSSICAEVQELNELLAVAKLPAVRKVLEDAVASFSAQHSTAPAAATPTAPAVVGMPPPVAAAVKPAQPSTETKYEHVTWGWDSGDKFVSVYITVCSAACVTTLLEWLASQ